MTTLTKKQKEALAMLKESTIRVCYSSPNIMRTFDSLVKKGLAQVIGKNITHKIYAEA